MMYFTDISIDSVMMEKGISATAARVLYHINRLVHASRMKGIRDGRGIPYSYASREAIAQRVGRSSRTIARAMAELKAARLIDVKRTRHNAHVYICYASDGTSGYDKNGTSNNNNKNINIQGNLSIHVSDKDMADGQTVMDGLLENVSEPHMASDTVKAAAAHGRPTGQPRATVKATGSGSVEAPRPAGCPTPSILPRPTGSVMAEGQQTKGRPTPKRPRISKAEQEEARNRYKRHLMNRLRGLMPSEFAYDLSDKAEADLYNAECARYEAITDMIADALSVPSCAIRVNGVTLTREQYWNIIKHIGNSDTIRDLITRLYGEWLSRPAANGIKNPRAYMLASVYNAVQWDMAVTNTPVKAATLERYLS